MPEGSAFRHDVFIGYASADNWNPSGVPWVTQFHNDLAARLADLLGRKPAICFVDTNARRYDASATRQAAATLDDVRGSAAFLAILSPSYVTTERTIAELDAFHNAAASSDRIFAVELLPVGTLDKLPHLNNVLRTRFWKDRGQSPAQLTPTSDAVHYAERIDSLAAQLATRLRGDNARKVAPANSIAATDAPMALMAVLPPEPPVRNETPTQLRSPLPPPSHGHAPKSRYPRTSPEYWLHRAAYERKLVPKADPLVLISYASEDQRWINELRSFLDLSLELLRDPDGRNYQLWSYSDTKRGTSPGDEFPEVVAEKMWHCRVALLVLSTDYFQSKYCRQIELPFLLWRREYQGLLCIPVRLGTLPVNRVRLPEFEHPSRSVIFDEMIDDRQAAIEFASSPHRDLSLLQLMERNIRSERDDRYQGLALRIANFLKAEHGALDD